MAAMFDNSQTFTNNFDIIQVSLIYWYARLLLPKHNFVAFYVEVFI